MLSWLLIHRSGVAYGRSAALWDACGTIARSGIARFESCLELPWTQWKLSSQRRGFSPGVLASPLTFADVGAGLSRRFSCVVLDFDFDWPVLL